MSSLAESWLGSEVTDPMIVEWASSKMAVIVQRKSELCMFVHVPLSTHSPTMRYTHEYSGDYVSGGSPSEVLRKSLWCQLSAIQHFLEKILTQTPEDDYLGSLDQCSLVSATKYI